jgi:hypothetical protein
MFVIGIVNRQKRFSAAKTVALAGVLALEFIQASSVKRFAIMFLLIGSACQAGTNMSVE